MSDHAVLIHLRLSDESFGTDEEREAIQDLGDQIEQSIVDAGVGEYDGDEFGEGKAVLFTYRHDADQLYEAIEHILTDSPLMKNGFVVKRYGPADDLKSKEQRIDF